MTQKRPIKVVLTGGPSAGKTSITDILFRSHFSIVNIVPEAASILFRGGFPRATPFEHIKDQHKKCQQIAIYHVQNQLEAMAALDPHQKAHICDRGTLDGLAYWPGDEAEFFKAIDSTLDKEISRYDWVIHLDTAPPFDYQSSAIRTEPESMARVLNEKVREVWARHPQRLIVNSSTDFLHKVDVTLKILDMILTGSACSEIHAQLKSVGVK